MAQQALRLFDLGEARAVGGLGDLGVGSIQRHVTVVDDLAVVEIGVALQVFLGTGELRAVLQAHRLGRADCRLLLGHLRLVVVRFDPDEQVALLDDLTIHHRQLDDFTRNLRRNFDLGFRLDLTGGRDKLRDGPPRNRLDGYRDRLLTLAAQHHVSSQDQQREQCTDDVPTSARFAFGYSWGR